MTIDACKGMSSPDLEQQALRAFRYIGDNIQTARVVDPANSNNVISDDLTDGEKRTVRTAAQAALDARLWSDVFG